MLHGLFEGAQYNSEAGAKCAVYSRARTKQGRGVIKEIRYTVLSYPIQKRQGCHNLVTGLPQCFFYNLVTTMVARLSQGCTNIVTRLYEQCHKVATMHLVITLYFETVARLLQGGGKAVTTALSQPCIMNCNKIVPKRAFLVCSLANQALHSSNTNEIF